MLEISQSLRVAQRYLILVLLTAFVAPNTWAADWSEELPLSGHPRAQYVSIFKDAGTELVKATVKKTEKSLEVRGSLDQVPEESLVNAVVVLSNGEVISSPLHSFGTDELSRESVRLARQRIDRLDDSIADLQRVVSDLDAQIEDEREQLRQRAGLSEVSRVYRRVNLLEADTQQAEKAEQDNKRALEELRQGATP